MNGLRADLAGIEAVRAGIAASCKAGVWIFPPATLITPPQPLPAGPMS